MEQLGTNILRYMWDDPIGFGHKLNDILPFWLLIHNLIHYVYGMHHWPIEPLLYFNIAALAQMAGYRYYYGQIGTRRGDHQQ